MSSNKVAKTRFQREKEEREAKRRLAESEAASVYEDFVVSFEGESSRHTAVYRPESSSRSSVRGKKHIDSFLEELKSRQVEPVVAKGSFDDGDAGTTNLYVGSLPPDMTEEQLRGVFSKYGTVTSVKIMWPRTDEERARKRNCGFVSFETRAAADEARLNLHDVELDGLRLSVGWGKAVVPVKVPVTVQSSEGRVLRDDEPRVRVSAPADSEQRAIIDLVAEYVASDGADFEAVVRAREMSNPLFAFLRSRTPEATYYRWRVYSSVMGGHRTTPYLMQTDGISWVPPPSDDDVGTPRQEDKTRTADKTLHPDDRDTFKALVLQLTPSRAKVADAMTFALDHADTASDVVAVLLDAAVNCDPATSLSARVARLYLVSDVLKNSSAPVRGAANYRALLQAGLPAALSALNSARRASVGHARSAFEDRVSAVLAAWLRWSLFPPVFVHGLEATFFTDRHRDDAPFIAAPGGDLDSLRRKARLAGIPDSGTSSDLARRLESARAYVKFRALGHDPRSALNLASKSEHTPAEPVVLEEAPRAAPTPTPAAPAPTTSTAKIGTWVEATAEDDDNDLDLDGESMDDQAYDSVPCVTVIEAPAPPPAPVASVKQPPTKNGIRAPSAVVEKTNRPPNNGGQQLPTKNASQPPPSRRRPEHHSDPPRAPPRRPRGNNVDRDEDRRHYKRSRRSPANSSSYDLRRLVESCVAEPHQTRS